MNGQPNAIGKATSCFQSDSGFIICFYATKVYNVIYLNLIKYSFQFSDIVTSDISLTYKFNIIFPHTINIFYFDIHQS